jgi:uncharacterized protein
MASAPQAPSGSADLHVFEAGGTNHVLMVNGSRVYTVAPGVAEALGSGDPDTIAALGLSARDYIAFDAPKAIPVRALSLAIAQSCNLACSYCYADGGSFGGTARQMPVEVALASVEALLRDVPPGDRVNLAFLGGEPLVNRAVLRRCAEHAAARGAARGVRVGFSITTNGTLLTPEDGEFFERHGFAVTVSLDGTASQHDRLRPFKDGRGSFDRVLERTAPLLAMQRRMQVSARVTVTPANLTLQATLDELLGRGFHSVGFSPLLASSSGSGEMTAYDLAALLDQMMACGATFERRVADGERYAFQNLVSALEEIHRGSHRPYPCGAGGGYFGVSAGGSLYACHRFVEDPSAAMGSVGAGVDPERQRRWLAERHVHRQEPCTTCWARYLCGGGCHHEVLRRGRTACDYVRGWLHYCLQAYVRLLDARPDYFGAPQ